MTATVVVTTEPPKMVEEYCGVRNENGVKFKLLEDTTPKVITINALYGCTIQHYVYIMYLLTVFVNTYIN